MSKMIAAFVAAGLMMSACGSSSDDAAEVVTDDADTTSEAESSSDLSTEEEALVTALTEEALADPDLPFTNDEVRCVNEPLVQSIGLEELNSYGVTVDNPDDSLVPDEYELQKKGIDSILGCVNLGETMRALAPDCDIELTNEEMELALKFDFLGSFAEFEEAEEATAAADAMDAAIIACG